MRPILFKQYQPLLSLLPDGWPRYSSILAPRGRGLAVSLAELCVHRCSFVLMSGTMCPDTSPANWDHTAPTVLRGSTSLDWEAGERAAWRWHGHMFIPSLHARCDWGSLSLSPVALVSVSVIHSIWHFISVTEEAVSLAPASPFTGVCVCVCVWDLIDPLLCVHIDPGCTAPRGDSSGSLVTVSVERGGKADCHFFMLWQRTNQMCWHLEDYWCFTVTQSDPVVVILAWSPSGNWITVLERERVSTELHLTLMVMSAGFNGTPVQDRTATKLVFSHRYFNLIKTWAKQM